jgi:hypothetical protein
VEHIVKYQNSYHDYLQDIKNNGEIIMGYARKSPRCTIDQRKRSLDSMVEKLRTRSLVDKVFVLAYSRADDPLESRDLGGLKHEEYGTTQGIAHYNKVPEEGSWKINGKNVVNSFEGLRRAAMEVKCDTYDLDQHLHHIL